MLSGAVEGVCGCRRWCGRGTVAVAAGVGRALEQRPLSAELVGTVQELLGLLQALLDEARDVLHRLAQCLALGRLRQQQAPAGGRL